MTIGYFKIYFGTIGTDSIFAVPLKNREHSSAGSEHLPYKQRVTGSNPVAPTKPSESPRVFTLCTFYTFYIARPLRSTTSEKQKI